MLSDTYIERVLNWALENSRIVFLADLVGRDFSYLWAVPDRLSSDRISAVEDPGECVCGGGGRRELGVMV